MNDSEIKNIEIIKQIFQKIKEYKKIIICRHVRPDGDCVGSTIGLKELIINTYKEKEVKIVSNDYAEYLKFLGDEDEACNEDYYQDALIIVLDTATSKRISNDFVKKGKEIIKIDHHVETEPYGNINWVEDSRSSVSEMICQFYIIFKNEFVMTEKAATALYTGIVTDSGRFKFSSCDGDTLRNASVLLDFGINIESIFAHLYLKDINFYKLQAEVYKKIKLTANGVAYIYIDKKMQKRYKLSAEDASAMISVIDSILGSIIWIAFIENNDKSIRVRLRSRFTSIIEIGEKYHGGGHDKASGAVVYSKKEMKNLLEDADKKIKDYKESNKNWL